VLGATVSPTASPAAETQEITTDVCVIGAGSGGIAAALAAARAGAQVVLVEKCGQLGGTSVNAYVCNWEPGPGHAISREIYDRLECSGAVGITSDHNPHRKLGPFGLWMITPGQSYEQTLRRAALPRRRTRAVAFEPEAFSSTVEEMLRETGRCRLLLNTTFVAAKAEGKRVLWIDAKGPQRARWRIRARVFIDSTGGAHLCRALGCEVMLGPEPASRFHEPSAPEKPNQVLNAISLCYRVRKSAAPKRQPPPPRPIPPFPKSAHVHEIPSGDLIVNTLALLPGQRLMDWGYDRALDECRRRAAAHWHWLQGRPPFNGYEFVSFAPMLGIRESYRVVGEYVLTQHDLMKGVRAQPHRDVVALADHTMDVHGAGHRRVRGALRGPYGIPYRCLVPKGWQNLLVACRGASFSHVAASSCRLSRTIMALGYAAGTAAADAAQRQVPVMDVDTSRLKP